MFGSCYRTLAVILVSDFCLTARPNRLTTTTATDLLRIFKSDDAEGDGEVPLFVRQRAGDEAEVLLEGPARGRQAGDVLGGQGLGWSHLAGSLLLRLVPREQLGTVHLGLFRGFPGERGRFHLLVEKGRFPNNEVRSKKRKL